MSGGRRGSAVIYSWTADPHLHRRGRCHLPRHGNTTRHSPHRSLFGWSKRSEGIIGQLEHLVVSFVGIHEPCVVLLGKAWMSVVVLKSIPLRRREPQHTHSHWTRSQRWFLLLFDHASGFPQNWGVCSIGKYGVFLHHGFRFAFVVCFWLLSTISRQYTLIERAFGRIQACGRKCTHRHTSCRLAFLWVVFPAVIPSAGTKCDHTTQEFECDDPFDRRTPIVPSGICMLAEMWSATREIRKRQDSDSSQNSIDRREVVSQTHSLPRRTNRSLVWQSWVDSWDLPSRWHHPSSLTQIMHSFSVTAEPSENEISSRILQEMKNCIHTYDSRGCAHSHFQCVEKDVNRQIRRKTRSGEIESQFLPYCQWIRSFPLEQWHLPMTEDIMAYLTHE